MKKPVPVSYAQTIYHAEHAFRFTASDGPSRFGRYRFVPQAGEAFLSPDDAGKRSHSFLREGDRGMGSRVFVLRAFVAATRTLRLSVTTAALAATKPGDDV